jgi:hypothetical protein
MRDFAISDGAPQDCNAPPRGVEVNDANIGVIRSCGDAMPPRGAESGAAGATPESTDDFAFLKARWPGLPNHVIRGILAMIQAAQVSCD